MSNLNSDLHTWCFCLGFFIFLLPVSVQNFVHASPVTWNPGMPCALVAIENSSKVCSQWHWCAFLDQSYRIPQTLRSSCRWTCLQSTAVPPQKKPTHTQYWIFRLLVISVWGLEIISLTDPFSLLVDLYHSRVSLRSLEMFWVFFSSKVLFFSAATLCSVLLYSLLQFSLWNAQHCNVNLTSVLHWSLRDFIAVVQFPGTLDFSEKVTLRLKLSWFISITSYLETWQLF